jgi:hypothetical protein
VHHIEQQVSERQTEQGEQSHRKEAVHRTTADRQATDQHQEGAREAELARPLRDERLGPSAVGTGRSCAWTAGEWTHVEETDEHASVEDRQGEAALHLLEEKDADAPGPEEHEREGEVFWSE